MSHKKHQYTVSLEWTGNKGEGTLDYRAYERSHIISIENKPDILGTTDPAFRGDATRHNPEDLFLASLASCHMLWYLHLCSSAGVVVIAYRDRAEGVLSLDANGGGRFTSVVLHPEVLVTKDTMLEMANSLHAKANELCFIANSCNFEIEHKPFCTVAGS